MDLTLRPAPFRDGTLTEPGGRAFTSNYAEDVKVLLEEAIVEFKLTLFTVNAFPGPVELREAILSSWKRACEARAEPVQWHLSERMIRAVRSSPL